MKPALPNPTSSPSMLPNTPSEQPSTQEAKNISVSIENSFSTDFPNTILIGTSAEVKTKITDVNNKPIMNKAVRLSQKAIWEKNSAYSDNYRNLTDTVLTTDANGYVTFVFGLDKSKDDVGTIDSTCSRYVSSFQLTASVVGTPDIKASTTVKFAALSAGGGITVSQKPDAGGSTVLAPTVNKAIDGTTSIHSIADVYHDRNGNLVEYVTSQQVSAKGTDHSVTFTANGIALELPKEEGAETFPEEINETINFDTEKYSTYTSTAKWAKVIDTVKASGLQYATINFGKLSLSKYSRFIVNAYIVQDKANPLSGEYTSINLSSDTDAYVEGEKVSDDFSVQIPVNTISSSKDSYLYVTAGIESKGQVNTDVNEGFTVKSITGVKKKSSSAVSNTPVSIKGIHVEWAKDGNAEYTLNTELTAEHYPAITGKLAVMYPQCTYMYQVPAFPRTGNGIITVFDSADKAVAYFAIPVQNPLINGSNKEYQNRNIIADTDVTKMYQISKAEAFNHVGTITTDANGNARVDSKQTGVTHVVGTLTSTNDNVKISPENRLIYTSVNWNPIPTASSDSANMGGQAGAALVGQQITLTAQLTDKNGNPVTTSGISIEFEQDNSRIIEDSLTVGGASVVKIDNVTNTSGRAELILVAGKPAQALNIRARTVSSGKQFGLTYVLGSETVTKEYVDLYWIDANLYFEPVAGQSDAAVRTYYNKSTADTDHSDAEPYLKPTVGSHWAYEVRTTGDISQTAFGTPLGGMLTGCTDVSIAGLAIQTTAGADSVGTIANNVNGKADVTSVKAGVTNLVNILDSKSAGNNVKFTFTGGASGDITVANVGTGDAALDKKLTLNIHWTTSTPDAEIFIPTGSKADAADPLNVGVKVYVLVHDASGNPLDNKKVTLNVNGKGALDYPATKKKEESYTVNGIASFTVYHDEAESGDRSILTAAVDGITGIFTGSIQWADMSIVPLQVTKVAYDYMAKTIRLTFNHDIYAKSVVKEQFTVAYGTAGIEEEQIVTDTIVSGNMVTLSIPALTNVNANGNFKITIEPKIKNGMEYTFASADGQRLDIAQSYNVVEFTVADINDFITGS